MNKSILSDFESSSVAVVSGLGLTVLLFLSVPYMSGVMNKKDRQPVMVFDSISLYKKIDVPVKKAKQKPKPEIKKQKKKVVKKNPHSKKRINKKVVKKTQAVDKLFATKNQTIVKAKKSQLDALPVPEPIYNVDRKPQLLLGAKPVFPHDMKVLGKTAVVQVDALIDRYGKVRKATIYKSAGESFNQAAINAVMASLFAPASIAGKPCAVIYRMSIKFKLK